MKIINLQEYPFILDHRLSQHAIIPATWYLQTILSQSLNKYELPISLEDLHYLKAISIELDTDFLAEVRLDNDQCCIYKCQ